MGLFRLLILLALVATAIWLWRRLVRKPQSGHRPNASAPAMVRCAQCGVHVPQSQALRASDRWYCSQAHLQQGQDHGGR